MLSYGIGMENVMIKIQETRSIFATREYEYLVLKDGELIHKGIAESSSWGNEKDAIVNELNYCGLGEKLGNATIFNENEVTMINVFTVEEKEEEITIITMENDKEFCYHLGQFEYFTLDGVKYQKYEITDLHEWKGLLFHMKMLAHREKEKMNLV